MILTMLEDNKQISDAVKSASSKKSAFVVAGPMKEMEKSLVSGSDTKACTV